MITKEESSSVSSDSTKLNKVVTRNVQTYLGQAKPILGPGLLQAYNKKVKIWNIKTEKIFKKPFPTIQVIWKVPQRCLKLTALTKPILPPQVLKDYMVKANIFQGLSKHYVPIMEIYSFSLPQAI